MHSYIYTTLPKLKSHLVTPLLWRGAGGEAEFGRQHSHSNSNILPALTRYLFFFNKLPAAQKQKKDTSRGSGALSKSIAFNNLLSPYVRKLHPSDVNSGLARNTFKSESQEASPLHFFQGEGTGVRYYSYFARVGRSLIAHRSWQASKITPKRATITIYPSETCSLRSETTSVKSETCSVRSEITSVKGQTRS
jgi:hypothetical protein